MTQTQPETFRTESRTFTWASPGQADPRRLKALDGIGQLRAMAAGELPPPSPGALSSRCRSPSSTTTRSAASTAA